MTSLLTQTKKREDWLCHLQGLTEDEVILRRSSGKGNNVPVKTSRSYAQICRENLLTFINFVFFTISMAMFFLGRYSDAFLVFIVIFGGVLVNIYQEVWAKRQLDRIALLNRPKATVLREGIEKIIKPEEIVLGDLLIVRQGDPFFVDGILLTNNVIEVDESLLTGESDPIPKKAGQAVYSGSFCISGTACYEAQKVGRGTLTHQIMTKARGFRQVLTPLQQEVNVIIRTFFLIACFMWLLVAMGFLIHAHSLNELVQKSAVIAGLVPSGLLLAITLAYGLGAVRMASQNLLIQQSNAVESLSHINVLCLDKTGTLTTNQLHLHSIYPFEVDCEELEVILGTYGASTTAKNKTIEAIIQAYPKPPLKPVVEIPFSSARQWSALVFEGDVLCSGVHVLGAPEVLTSATSNNIEINQQIQEATNQGRRVLLLAYSPNQSLVHQQVPSLPTDLIPLGLIVFEEQLRPEISETLAGFMNAGIEIKIISGDHPKTVTALAKRVGLEANLKTISGQELAQMNKIQFAQTAKETTVFGRITPEQKAQLVESLRQQGCYVAMTGDGVNDVLSLKQANLALAMESGSQATRCVADLVLLNDSFATLPHAFLEGQRIRNGIQDVMKLFMVRTFCVTLLLLATALITDSFPLENKQSALVTLIGVGLPTLFIPAWASPKRLSQQSLIRSILHFVVPATLSLTLISLLTYLLYLVVARLDISSASALAQIDFKIPRSALVTILVFGELLLIPFLKPPTTAFVGGERLSGDWRYCIVALILAGIFGLILAVPHWCQFFELSTLSPISYLFLALVALEWSLILRALWRTRFLERFLGVDFS